MLLYLLALAGYLALLAGLSAVVGAYAPRLACLRPLLGLAGLVVFARWGIRLLAGSGRVPEPLRSGLVRAAGLFTRAVCSLVFSPRIGLIAAGAVFAFTSLFAVWYASLGLFPGFPRVGNLYINQAQAFLHGQLALLEPPSAEILALPDPYVYPARQGLPYLWDASLFQGRYYLYWGPLPALMLAGIMAVSGTVAPDPLLVALSAIGLAAVVFWLAWRIRKCYFPQAPALSIGLFLLVTTLNLPVLFLLGRGRVYETSIITGQLFLFLGLAGYLGFAQSGRPAGLVLAGLGWGLAVTCRYNLALSAAVFLAFALWGLWSVSVPQNGAAPQEPAPPRPPAVHRTGFLSKAALLLAPFALCLLGLGLFNAMRFGSPFETGLNYQLTAPVYRNQHFSPAYLPTSFYLNVLYPYRRVDTFPLIRSIAVVPAKAPAWVNYHPGKQVDETIYSLRLMPFLGLLALLPALGIRRRLADQPPLNQPTPPAPSAWPHLAWMIGLAGLLQFGLLLLYYYSAVRFMADYSLSFLLVTLFMLWALDQRLTRQPWLRLLLWAGAALAALLTVLLGFLAGFDNPPQVFHIYNPALETQIGAAWDSLFTSPGLLGKLLRYLLVPFL